MKNDILIVAFYTINSLYEELAKRLEKRLNELGYNYYIKGYENRGNWQKNTRIKAEFLHYICEKYNGSNILYLDVDCDIVRKFNILEEVEEDTDIAMVQERFPYRPQLNEMLGGTIYFNANEKVCTLFADWVKNCKISENSSVLEQYELQKLIEKRNNINFKRLPVEYCFIFDTCRKIYPNANPYIVENQASRTTRR